MVETNDQTKENTEVVGTKLANIDDPIIQSLATLIDEELLENLTLTPKEVQILVKYVTKFKGGEHASLPMVCSGPRCIYNKVCPFLKIGKPPLGKTCPIEKHNVEVWKADYAKSLDADMNDKTERSQIMEIVESDILNARANIVLADEGFIMLNTVGIDFDSGQEITRKEEHIALRLKDRAQDRKDKKFKDFIATRKDKMGAMTAMKEDPTEYFSRLKNNAKEASARHSKLKIVDVVEAEKSEPKKEEEPF